MKILELFEEDNGRLSNMRLNCTVMIGVGCFLMVYAMLQTKTVDANTITAATLMFTLGLGGKIAQKGQEQKA